MRRADETWIARQRLAHGFEIASIAGIDEGGGIGGHTAVDLLLQSAPAGEAMVAGHAKKSCCQLDVRVSSTQLAQPILREFPEVFEGWTIGELETRHEPLLPCAPGVRVARAGSQGV